jgi:hypothetical protein
VAIQDDIFGFLKQKLLPEPKVVNGRLDRMGERFERS